MADAALDCVVPHAMGDGGWALATEMRTIGGNITYAYFFSSGAGRELLDLDRRI